MCQQDHELREKFLFTLEWLLALTKRYTGKLQFNLVHVNFANSRLLGDTYGAQEAVHKLDEVLHSLIKAFRKTDLVARVGVDFWILAPYTPTDENLAAKTRHIIHVASQCGLQIVERDISVFSLPVEAPELGDNCSATEFLAYLKKNHSTLASLKISLPPSKAVDA